MKANDNSRQLGYAVSRGQHEWRGQHTMLVARNQKMIDIGNEMIYLTRLVKLHSRKKFPAKPQANDTAFNTSSLYQFSLVSRIIIISPTNH